MSISLSFYGAVGTVTGSKYLLESEGRKLLVDCGLFQGFKQLRLRNWAPPPFNPAELDGVILTHAHIDHSGYLPRLVKAGFKGPIYATSATRDLCEILLPDSGHLQERDADFANRHGYSRHRPALPLYTAADANAAMPLFKVQEFGETKKLKNGASFRFLYAGHILGAAMIDLRWHGTRVLFSGDLGRPNDPIMQDPETVEETDYLIVESTYGNRRHDPQSAEDALAAVIARTVGRGGTVVIPSFAVGRTQMILVMLHRLRSQQRIPRVPIYLDSPMAMDASDIFIRHRREHRLGLEETRAAMSVATYVRPSEDSKSLDHDGHTKVIVSASGMATGGRVLHHLERFAPEARNAIVFVGFQAGGTRGAAMIEGAETVKIHGQYVPIRAEVVDLHMLSAHADADETLAWLRKFKTAPRTTFVTHGEPAAADALRHRIAESLDWNCSVPDYRDTVELS